MSIRFGVGNLYLMQNLVTTNCVASTGTAGTGIAVTSGQFMLDGITGVLSASTSTLTIAGSTGTGLLLYASIVAGSTITGSLTIVTAADPINTSVGIPTSIVPIARFSFGTGASVVSTIIAWSGGSATKTIGRVQNVSISLSSELAQMRGGGDVYPIDSQPFNGACEGSFQFSDPTATQFILFGGTFLTAGGNSGTWTLSAVSKPEPVSLVFENTTNGQTGVYALMRVYFNQKALEFSRTDYMQPTWSFIAQSNFQGTVLTMQQ